MTIVSAIALCRGGWAVERYRRVATAVKTKVKITEGGATHFAGKVTSKECEVREGSQGEPALQH